MNRKWAIIHAIVLLALASAALLKTGATPRPAQSAGAETEKLGSVKFPTSCSEAAQKPFEKGVALLHSFQYDDAAAQFQDAAMQDSRCAMAHWGVAMTRWYELWEAPDTETRKQGWADVEAAQKISTQTERERGYIAAVAAFYRHPEKPGFAERAQAYSAAMERLYRANPQDGEAAAFYGPSLIALPEPDPQTDSADRGKAIAVLQQLFFEHTDHPGAAHYLIHATDTPQFAPFGLVAARRYAKIAPASAHALHMPSHIFSRLGLWQESIESNLAAAAAKAATLWGTAQPGYQLHAMDYLQYAYLQTGQDARARELIDEVESVPGSPATRRAMVRAQFAARFALEPHNWKDAAALAPPEGSRRGVQASIYTEQATGAARSGDVPIAREAVKKLSEVSAKMREENRDSNSPMHGEPVGLLEAGAWLAFAEGKKDDALATLRKAAEQEDNWGSEELAIPAREMLGEMLLEFKRPAEALAAFELSLRDVPNRFNSLFGAARSSELGGDAAGARKYYGELVAICPPGAAGPALEQARLFLARK